MQAQSLRVLIERGVTRDGYIGEQRVFGSQNLNHLDLLSVSSCLLVFLSSINPMSPPPLIIPSAGCWVLTCVLGLGILAGAAAVAGVVVASVIKRSKK